MKLIKALIISVFIAVYCLISLGNHYYFRTFYWDLTNYINAMYHYVHFNIDQFLFLNGGHFDVIAMLVSPLTLVFGTYALLVVQVTAIIAGGIGVFNYIYSHSNKALLSILAMLHFYLFFSIYTALYQDYHGNVIGAMLVPWFFLFVQKENWGKASIIFTLIILSKENMSLWLFFICIGLAFNYKNDWKKIKKIFFFGITALIYFFYNWVCYSVRFSRGRFKTLFFFPWK